MRTNITDWSAEDLWRAYVQLTEAKAAFRIEKSDLRTRPIWHQKEERVLSHILVCFLTYVLWTTLGRMVKYSGLGDEPRRVLDELSKDQPGGRCAADDIGRGNPQTLHHPPDGIVALVASHQEILLQHLDLNVPRQFKK